MILSHGWLNRMIQLIVLHELREDLKDIAVNYFIILGQNFSISLQHSAAICMLLTLLMQRRLS
jgi:uncharacterized membrane protein